MGTIPEFNLEDYVRTSYSGHDGYAEAYAVLDEDVLYVDIYKAKGLSSTTRGFVDEKYMFDNVINAERDNYTYEMSEDLKGLKREILN